MKIKGSFLLFLTFTLSISVIAQKADLFNPDFNSPPVIPGMTLVWNDEFNIEGKPDPSSWMYEYGFVRNNELQWYQQENANCSRGVLVIEGRREMVRNPGFVPESKSWVSSREYANYTSASIQTKGLKQWQFGRFEIRARIDTAHGAWPAISGEWTGMMKKYLFTSTTYY